MSFTKASSKFVSAAIWISTAAALLFAVFFLNRLKVRAVNTPFEIQLPQELLRGIYWPGKRWPFDEETLTLRGVEGIVLRRASGTIDLNAWNLLWGCKSGINLNAARTVIAAPSMEVFVKGLQQLFRGKGAEKKAFQRYLCQTTSFKLSDSQLEIEPGQLAPITLSRMEFYQSESPRFQVEGADVQGHPFGLIMTYKPFWDTVAVTADIAREGRFDGQIERFSSLGDALLIGEVHLPRFEGVLGSKKQGRGLSLSGQFSVSGELSGRLEELLTSGFHAQSLNLEGAFDARSGQLSPNNIPAEILREAGTIPALAALSRLINDKALPNSFYTAETTYEVFRFLFHQENGRVTASRLLVKHEDYLIAAEAVLDLNTNSLELSGNVVLSEELSQDLIRNVNALSILASSEGKLTFPFKMTGSLQSVKVHADIKQITESLIEAYRSELVRRGKTRMETLP